LSVRAVHATPVSVSSVAGDIWIVKLSARTATVGLSSEMGNVITISPGLPQISGTVSVARFCALARSPMSKSTATAQRRPRVPYTRDITVIFFRSPSWYPLRIRCCGLRRQ